MTTRDDIQDCLDRAGVVVTPEAFERFLAVYEILASEPPLPASPNLSPYFQELQDGVRQIRKALVALHQEGPPMELWPQAGQSVSPTEILRVLDQLDRWGRGGAMAWRKKRGRPPDPRIARAVVILGTAIEEILGIPATPTAGNAFIELLVKLRHLSPDGALWEAKEILKTCRERERSNKCVT